MRTIYYVLASRALEICPNAALAKRVREVDGRLRRSRKWTALVERQYFACTGFCTWAPAHTSLYTLHCNHNHSIVRTDPLPHTVILARIHEALVQTCLA